MTTSEGVFAIRHRNPEKFCEVLQLWTSHKFTVMYRKLNSSRNSHHRLPSEKKKKQLYQFNDDLMKKGKHFAKKKFLFMLTIAKFIELSYELLPYSPCSSGIDPVTISCFEYWRNGSAKRNLAAKKKKETPYELYGAPKRLRWQMTFLLKNVCFISTVTKFSTHPFQKEHRTETNTCWETETNFFLKRNEKIQQH